MLLAHPDGQIKQFIPNESDVRWDGRVRIRNSPKIKQKDELHDKNNDKWIWPYFDLA